MLTKYLQYNESGEIIAEVIGNKPPVCENQISVEADTNTIGMFVDVKTKELIPFVDAPVIDAVVSVDMNTEWDLVISDKEYFKTNFTKNG